MRSAFIALLIVGFVLTSLVPAFYEIGRRNSLRPERDFELVHNFPTDFNFYLSRIRQGIEGRTSVIEQYTSEPHEGSFLQVFYLGLGWLGRWWRVPEYRPGDVYHMARIVLGLTLLTLIWQFCKKAFPQREMSSSGLTRGSSLLSKMDSSFRWNDTMSILAFLLAVTASTWPKLLFYNGGWRFGGYMPWWSVMDSLQRITFIPHLLAGQSLIIALLLMLTNEAAMRRGGSWVFTGLLGFSLGIIFPPGLLFIFVVLFFLTLLELATRRRNTNTAPAGNAFDILLQRGVFVLLSAPALGYLQLMTSFYPWKRLVQVDIIRPLPFDYLEYFKAVGPVLPLGLVGLVAALIRREKLMILPVAWVIAWLFLLFAFKLVPQQSPLRFSEMIVHVPLAVLTTYGLFLFFKRAKVLLVTCLLSLIALGLGVMLSSWWWQRDFVDHKIRAAYPLVPTGSYVMYPLKDFRAAMFYIHDHTSSDAVIFSETTAGNYLPVVAGRTVFAGHDNTVGYEQKQEILKRFFGGKMSSAEAKSLLESSHVAMIFFGPQEKEDGGIKDLTKSYPFLQSVYSNSFVTVYTL